MTSPAEADKLYYMGVVDVKSIEHNILQEANDDFLLASYKSSNARQTSSATASTNPSTVLFKRSVEQRIVERVEYAQLTGVIPTRPQTEKNEQQTKEVYVHISKTGVKLVDVKNMRVVERLALHKIIQSISYADSNSDRESAYNVVLLSKQNDFSDKRGDQCYVLQTPVAEVADRLCGQLGTAFNAVKADVQLSN